MNKCRIYWGSHGCSLPRGHDGHHVCCCIDPEKHWVNPEHDTEDGARCVGTWPYYGPELETRFYGEDVPAGWMRVEA